jgi:hypothetical protein
MLSFSADSDSKHQPGFHIKQCEGWQKERNCSFNDGGKKNQHGVWWIGKGTPKGFESMKPEDVKHLLVPTCPDRSNVSKMPHDFLARCVRV